MPSSRYDIFLHTVHTSCCRLPGDVGVLAESHGSGEKGGLHRLGEPQAGYSNPLGQYLRTINLNKKPLLCFLKHTWQTQFVSAICP